MSVVETRLGTVATFKYGKLYPKVDLLDGGYPVFSGYGTIGYRNEFNYLEPQLVVVCRGIGGTGDIKMSPPKCSVTNLAIVISPDEKKIDKNYLFWLLKAFDTHSLRTGSAQPQITVNSLEAFPIRYVESIEEQKAIAKILSSLDDKIELNRRMNATLEAMARALFKAWFVDFEPVHANRENRPSTSASPEIAKLFPSNFENGIPKGWRLGKLGDVLEAKGGTTPSTKNPSYWNGENYWATPKDLSNLRFPVLLRTERRITDEGVRQISSAVLPKGTLLLSSRAPIGYLAISQVPVSINQGFIAIHGKEVSNLFMLYWLMENMESVKSRANGSTFQEISKSSFREVEITLASNSILERFETLTKPTFEKIVANEIESQNLAEIRDSLLPRLISGRIRVSEMERTIEVEAF